MVMDISEEKVKIYIFTFIHNIYYCFLGIQSKLEKATRVDLNNDGIIGRPLDTYPRGGQGGFR